MAKKILEFWKLQATGNDFIAIQMPSSSFHKEDMSKYAIDLCRRRFSVGADGLMFIEILSSNELRWHFFNADGSPAEMCGNAARALVKLSVEEWGLDPKLSLHTLSGIVQLEYHSPENLWVQMSMGQKIAEYQGENIWNTGVPHACLEREFSLSKLEPLLKEVPSFRRPPVLDENGCNLSFWKEVSSGNLEAVSFERGVEGFTLACGTGVSSCALDYWEKRCIEGEAELQVKVPGGDLKVRRDSKGSLFLIGSAEVVCRGERRENEI